MKLTHCVAFAVTQHEVTVRLCKLPPIMRGQIYIKYVLVNEAICKCMHKLCYKPYINSFPRMIKFRQAPTCST